MIVLRLLPVLVSSVLLAAHFLRSGQLVLVLICISFPLLLFVRQTWAVRIVQVVLLLGGFEWIRTLLTLVAERVQAGQPWVRMSLILLAVALWTAGSLLVFLQPSLKVFYGLGLQENRQEKT